ncbi:hypothetical protein CALVIDRAFT_560478 [Calocera viscosa TUFC12733]|uniref:Uncharacterized protein n=1 Tax=Calocera viscosa (strain TUFC12733) TaxID=1330018 RepID=A0A167R375_CALVF|nr:hypothetical protein CALVIDRAFT_560478 [Calocera viscosa TUFC12733]
MAADMLPVVLPACQVNTAMEDHRLALVKVFCNGFAPAPIDPKALLYKGGNYEYEIEQLFSETGLKSEHEESTISRDEVTEYQSVTGLLPVVPNVTSDADAMELDQDAALSSEDSSSVEGKMTDWADSDSDTSTSEELFPDQNYSNWEVYHHMLLVNAYVVDEIQGMGREDAREQD